MGACKLDVSIQGPSREVAQHISGDYVSLVEGLPGTLKKG